MSPGSVTTSRSETRWPGASWCQDTLDAEACMRLGTETRLRESLKVNVHTVAISFFYIN